MRDRGRRYAFATQRIAAVVVTVNGAVYLGDDGEWYEDYAADQISRVTSDRLFAHDPATGKLKWTYQRGAILNSTITIAWFPASLIEIQPLLS